MHYSGVFWNAFMVDKNTMQVVLSWDTAQFNEQEAEGYLDEYIGIVRRMAQAQNLDTPLGELFGL